MPDSKSGLLWSIASFLSAVLLFGGLGAMCLDYAVNGGIDFIDDHFALALWANLIGVVLCFVCLLGWARHSDRRGRIRIGATTLFLCGGVGIAGILIRPTDVHGPFSLLFVTLLPISLLGLMMCIHALRRKPKRGRSARA